MSNEQETLIAVNWEDLLDFGRTFEAFSDLLRERVAEEFDIEYSEDVIVTSYGFHHVNTPAELVLHVFFEVEEDEDDAVYQITPKGKLTLELMRRLKLDFEQASQITDEVFEGAEVES